MSRQKATLRAVSKQAKVLVAEFVSFAFVLNANRELRSKRVEELRAKLIVLPKFGFRFDFPEVLATSATVVRQWNRTLIYQSQVLYALCPKLSALE